MKKLINSPSRVVEDALRGLQTAYPDRLRVDVHNGIVSRQTPHNPDNVAIISGGGSGHEPLHSGYVGTGMLSAAAIGEIFTSPTPIQIRRAILETAGPAGALLIVKNYSGDVMNFEMAVEMTTEVPLELVTVADDIALPYQDSDPVRRGVGLTVLLEKLVGAAAERGQNLNEIAELADKINRRGRSLGVALSAGTHPAAGNPTFSLGEVEMEFGVGIHGEPGIERLPLEDAETIGARLVQGLLEDYSFQDRQVIVLLSGLGSTPIAELHTVYAAISHSLQSSNVSVERSLIGNYVTALDMAGCTLTLLDVDQELLTLWDDPVLTPALRWKT